MKKFASLRKLSRHPIAPSVFISSQQTPQNKSHREEAILVKDLVRESLRQAERNGNHAALREDLAKVLQVAEGLHGNHSRGKVIFACREQGIWRELDVPPRLGRSQIAVSGALPSASAGGSAFGNAADLHCAGQPQEVTHL